MSATKSLKCVDKAKFEKFIAEVRVLNEDRFWKCRNYLAGHNRRLQTFIGGIVEAPTDKCSEFCKRAANRELRHVLKLASIMRHYIGGNQ